MNHPSNPAALAFAVVLCQLLAACSTPPAAPAAPASALTTAQAAAAARAEADEKRETITGSRIPSKTSDRLVKRTDAAGAREMDRDRAPDPGPMRN